MRRCREALIVIRPAVADDRDGIASLIRRRAAWMRDGGLLRWRGWEIGADVLAGQADDPRWAVWVVVAESGAVIGVTTTDVTPELGWTEQERAEPAVFLQSTVTDPAHAGVGMAIAFWALDFAARRGDRWVRRGVLTDGDGGNAGLVRYYRRQGWRVVRRVGHSRKAGITVWSLARPAERQAWLAYRGGMASFGELFPGVKKLRKESDEDGGGELFEAGPLDLDAGVVRLAPRPKPRRDDTGDDDQPS